LFIGSYSVVVIQELQQRQLGAQEDVEQLRADFKALKQSKRSLELKLSEQDDNLNALQQRLNKEGEKSRRQEAEKAQLQANVEELSIKVRLKRLIFF
jgi:predicted nuclease with TOPRIM domain